MPAPAPAGAGCHPRERPASVPPRPGRTRCDPAGGAIRFAVEVQGNRRRRGRMRVWDKRKTPLYRAFHLVGLRGFEPRTSRPPVWRANQAALQPVDPHFTTEARTRQPEVAAETGPGGGAAVEEGQS